MSQRKLGPGSPQAELAGTKESRAGFCRFYGGQRRPKYGRVPGGIAPSAFLQAVFYPFPPHKDFG